MSKWKGNEYLGKKNIAINGQEMLIIGFYDLKNITVRFLNDNTVLYNQTVQDFETGNIKNPKCLAVHKTILKNRKIKVGEISTSKQGQQMRLIAYEDMDHVSVQFPDNTIMRNQTYDDFKHGRIKNINYHPAKTDDKEPDYEMIER